MSDMSTAQEITLSDRIDRMFAERLNVEIPSQDVNLIDEGYLDSLLFIDLLMALEEDFGVAIALEDVDFDKFVTVSAITDFVANHGAAANG